MTEIIGFMRKRSELLKLHMKKNPSDIRARRTMQELQQRIRKLIRKNGLSAKDLNR